MEAAGTILVRAICNFSSAVWQDCGTILNVFFASGSSVLMYSYIFGLLLPFQKTDTNEEALPIFQQQKILSPPGSMLRHLFPAYLFSN